MLYLCQTLLDFRNFVISTDTVRTLTYNDWETNAGDISHSVTALVTPTILASYIFLIIIIVHVYVQPIMKSW